MEGVEDIAYVGPIDGWLRRHHRLQSGTERSLVLAFGPPRIYCALLFLARPFRRFRKQGRGGAPVSCDAVTLGLGICHGRNHGREEGRSIEVSEKGYVFDQDWEAERARLAALQGVLDPHSNPAKSLVGRQRLESWTNGLKERSKRKK
jgi:hypothetical protein